MNIAAATQGAQLPGLTILRKIDDPIRLCTVYATDDGNLVVGLGGTRNRLLDWLLNLNPWLEACSLIPVIQGHILDTPMAKITFLGHSQGGCHAVQLSSYFSQFATNVEVKTIGALPTRKDFKPESNVTITHYVNRRDPMALVPWGLVGLGWAGSVEMVGPEGFPSLKSHSPSEYENLLQ